MSKTNLTFERCGITINNGVIIIEDSNYHWFDLHYNVKIEIDNNTNVIDIIGEKCNFTFRLGGYDIDESLYTDDSFEDYKTWFGFGSIKRRLKYGYIEKKERTKISYKSNNFIIKQNEKI